MLYDAGGYGIYVDGASNVILRNCNISNNGVGNGIIIKDGTNNVIQNITVLNAANGINITDSSKIRIYGNIIKDNKKAGITVSGTSNYITINQNNITNSKRGIELTSSNNIDIISNYIASNADYGVYINCPIVKINITGNFFYKNSFSSGGEIFNDVNTKGFFKQGGEELEIVNNNYMVGNDVRPVNANPNGGVFLGYTFEINENVACPILHVEYEQTLWMDRDYRLYLSNITQSKKGIYSISIINSKGEVAKGLSSVPVIFYLNKNNNYVSPQEGDVYKTVMMVDGTATVRFYANEFNESGNVLTAVLPGTSSYITGDQYKNVKTFNISDEYIPGNITESKLIISNLNTYPNSNTDYTITLVDINNNPITNEPVVFTINSKTMVSTTDIQGHASIKINQNAGVYTINVNYNGDDVDFSSVSGEAKITVNKIPAIISASNYEIFAKKITYYKVTLKDSSGNLLSNQKISFKINKKTYNVKTNSKGIAKIKIKLNRGTYKVVMNYNGNSKFTAVKKTNKIKVKKTLKTKLFASKITTTPKTSTKYTITLKDPNGNGISKQKITIKCNGKTYTKKTNSKGQVSIKVKFSKIKSYSIKASYKGSNKYKKSSATGKITVQKTSTVITAFNDETFPNTSKDYTVALKTTNGKAISKQSLKITLNGQTYTKTTDNNGQVIIPLVFSEENTYQASITYAGNSIYKSSTAVGIIKVSRIQTDILSYNRTFSKGSNEQYSVYLKDAYGNAVANQAISYTLNNNSYSQNTDSEGYIKINVSNLATGSYKININHPQSNQYGFSSSNNVITVSDKINVTFIDENISGSEIQAIFDNAYDNIEFLGNVYNDVSLTISKTFNITFMTNTVLNGKNSGDVLTIKASNLKISGLIINPNEGSGIIISDSSNVTVENNTISNNLDSSKLNKYDSGEMVIPGCGISLSNVSASVIKNNDVKSFFNAVFAQNSDDVEICNNTLHLSNYGINYGLNVKNTQITDNLITKNIGLYVMDVPEGPMGYGIFLNQSGVNVSITDNNISDNYMGISIDSNYSTGIVIKYNLICDNALEGIRFNAGYDLAVNAVEPDVEDNAIYRNAKGPSMMILGELSANPNGIYQYGLENETKRLQLGANWYGKTVRVTWDNERNITGYGTMCPRINTTYISISDIQVNSPNNYSVTFYKNDAVADKLPVFEMYATLNNNVEIKFNVVGGIGNFSFNLEDFIDGVNTIKISIGSLNDEYRTFEVLSNRTLNSNEIPS